MSEDTQDSKSPDDDVRVGMSKEEVVAKISELLPKMDSMIFAGADKEGGVLICCGEASHFSEMAVNILPRIMSILSLAGAVRVLHVHLGDGDEDEEGNEAAPEADPRAPSSKLH